MRRGGTVSLYCLFSFVEGVLSSKTSEQKTTTALLLPFLPLYGYTATSISLYQLA